MGRYTTYCGHLSQVDTHQNLMKSGICCTLFGTWDRKWKSRIISEASMKSQLLRFRIAAISLALSPAVLLISSAVFAQIPPGKTYQSLETPRFSKSTGGNVTV